MTEDPEGAATPRARETAPPEERAPFLGSWGALYAFVLLDLLAVILICLWITRWNA